MQKNSEIRLMSLISIKTRSCLYPMLPFEFGIAGHQSAIPNSECSPRDKSLEVLTVKGFCFNMWNQRNALFSD